MSILLGSKLEKEITECLFTSFLSIFYKILKRRFAFEKVSEAERYSFDRVIDHVSRVWGGTAVDSCLNNTRFSKTDTAGDTFPCSRANREKDTGTRRTRRKKRPIMNLLFLYSFSRKNSIKVGLSINWTTA